MNERGTMRERKGRLTRSIPRDLEHEFLPRLSFRERERERGMPPAVPSSFFFPFS